MYEFTSKYHKYKNNSFEMLFQKYTASAVNKNYHPSNVELWKANMDKESYEDNLHKVVHLTLENRQQYRYRNEDHWPKRILDEIEWFHFQGIFEHTDFHTKGEKTLLHSLLKMFNMFSIIIWNNEKVHADEIVIK